MTRKTKVATAVAALAQVRYKTSMTKAPAKVWEKLLCLTSQFQSQAPLARLTWFIIPLVVLTLLFAPWELRHVQKPSMVIGVRYAPPLECP